MPAEIRLYFDTARNTWISPAGIDHPTARIDLTRQHYTVLHVQGVDNYKFAPDATTGTAPTSAIGSTWADQTGTPIAALKTPTQYSSSTSDFTAGFSGYTADTWHSLASKRFSVGVLVPSSVTAGNYYLGMRLANDGGQYTHFPLLACTLHEELITGDEATAPTSEVSYTGTAQIVPGATASTAVTITGLTASANVQVTLLGSSTNFTSFAYTATSGSFAVNRPGTSGTSNFAYSVRSL